MDIRAFPGVDEVRDLAEPWEGLDGVTHVYGEHFIEHLTLHQAVAFLEHARGVMAPEGRIRLSTPSLEWVHVTHFDPNRDAESVLGQTFTFNRAFYGWGHRFLWSRPMIDKVLSAMGYVDVSYHAYGDSEDPVLKGQEQHGGYRVDGGFPSVWIVEAARGSATETDRDALLAEIEDKFAKYVASGH